MKILLLSSVEHQSGSAIRFRGIAGALAVRGHDVHLLEPAAPGRSVPTPAGVRRWTCPRLPVSPPWQAPLWLAHGFVAATRVRPDVVFALKALPNVWVPAVWARLRGARLAVDLDDLDHAYYRAGPTRSLLRWFFRRAAADADDVTTHNEPMRELVATLRSPKRPVTFLDQGVDVALFGGAREAAGLRDELGLGPGPVILYAGHLGPASDLGSLLPALARVAGVRPEANLLVVGDGPERARLETLARSCLPDRWAVFAGTVEHEAVPAFYALADVAVNFLEDGEANRYRASIKTREALAAGVPVVASRTPDAERFADFVRLADRGPARFADALLEELASPDRERAARGAAWLAAHGTHAACVEEIARRWEGEE